MENSPNNFLEDPDEQSNFGEIDLLAFNSPFTNLNDNETPNNTLFGLSTHSSINYHSDQHFSTASDTITRLSKQRPFKIIRSPQKYNQEMLNISINSKKIKKQYIPKKRLKPKQEIAALLLKVPQKYIPDGIENPDIDDRERRRLMQKLKNRLASQHTRDQRKQRLSELEEVNMLLEMANKELNEKNRLLNERNKELEERLRAVENEKLMLLEENGKLTGENAKCIEDPQDYFDLNGGNYEENRFSPKLTRKQNDCYNRYFNFLVGVIMIFTVYTSAGIQIQHEPSESHLDFQSKVNEPVTSESRSIYLNERINFESKAEVASFEVDFQKLEASANNIKNFYFVRQNGLAPLRSAANNEYEPDRFETADFRRWLKRIAAASLYLVHLSMDPRSVVIIFLISLLLCSFMALQYQTIETRSPLKMVSDKEAELRKKRIMELQSKASAWKSQFQVYCEDEMGNHGIFDKDF